MGNGIRGGVGGGSSPPEEWRLGKGLGAGVETPSHDGCLRFNEAYGLL